jgi:hypothetical protein
MMTSVAMLLASRAPGSSTTRRRDFEDHSVDLGPGDLVVIRHRPVAAQPPGT